MYYYFYFIPSFFLKIIIIYLSLLLLGVVSFLCFFIFISTSIKKKNWCNLRYVTQQNLFFIVSYLYVFLISIYFNLDHNLRLS